MRITPAAVLEVLVSANTPGASESLTRLDHRLKAGGGGAASARFDRAFEDARRRVDKRPKGIVGWGRRR